MAKIKNASGDFVRIKGYPKSIHPGKIVISTQDASAWNVVDPHDLATALNDVIPGFTASYEKPVEKTTVEKLKELKNGDIVRFGRDGDWETYPWFVAGGKLVSVASRGVLTEGPISDMPDKHWINDYDMRVETPVPVEE